MIKTTLSTEQPVLAQHFQRCCISSPPRQRQTTQHVSWQNRKADLNHSPSHICHLNTSSPFPIWVIKLYTYTNQDFLSAYAKVEITFTSWNHSPTPRFYWLSSSQNYHSQKKLLKTQAPNFSFHTKTDKKSPQQKTTTCDNSTGESRQIFKNRSEKSI